MRFRDLFSRQVAQTRPATSSSSRPPPSPSASTLGRSHPASYSNVSFSALSAEPPTSVLPTSSVYSSRPPPTSNASLAKAAASVSFGPNPATSSTSVTSKAPLFSSQPTTLRPAPVPPPSVPLPPPIPRLFPDSELDHRPHARLCLSRYLASTSIDSSNQRVGALSLDSAPSFKRLAVSRGDYSSVERAFSRPSERLYTIVGPTGCGKSTFALLPIVNKLSCLIICPTKANLANLLVEFNTRMPDTIAKHRLPLLCPTASHCSFLSYVDPPSVLSLCTAQEFCLFVSTRLTTPPVDVIVLDEYHLGTSHVIKSRFLLRYCIPRSTFSPAQSVVFVSATPPDEPPPPVRTSGITIVRTPIPDILSLPVPSVFRLSSLSKYSNNYLLIVADSCSAAHILRDRLEGLGEVVFSLCKCPSPEQAAGFLRDHPSNATVIATPDTEAGISVPCSYMTNPGTALRVEFLQSVIVPLVTHLGPRQANQRLGRAGRFGHTVVFLPEDGEDRPTDDASFVLLAEAYLLVLHLTGSHPTGGEAALVSKRFTRLSKLSPKAATKTLGHFQPLAALYQADDRGNTYLEYGGSASSFVSDNAADFRLFKWPGGSAYAPYLDLCAPHDLTKGMTLNVQRSISDAILDNHPELASEVNLNAALSAAVSDPLPFAESIWRALKELSGPSNLTAAYVDTSHERVQPSYMLGSVGARAWSVLVGLGGYITVSPELSPTSQRVSRIFHFRSDSFSFNSSTILGSDSLVSDAKVTALLMPPLRPVAATQVLLNHPQLSIDLSDFRVHRERSSNPWFQSLFPTQ